MSGILDRKLLRNHVQVLGIAAAYLSRKLYLIKEQCTTMLNVRAAWVIVYTLALSLEKAGVTIHCQLFACSAIPCLDDLSHPSLPLCPSLCTGPPLVLLIL